MTRNKKLSIKILLKYFVYIARYLWLLKKPERSIFSQAFLSMDFPALTIESMARDNSPFSSPRTLSRLSIK